MPHIPAVVAMQFEISDEAAIVFAGGFYEPLAAGSPVDASLAAARLAMLAESARAVERAPWRRARPHRARAAAERLGSADRPIA